MKKLFAVLIATAVSAGAYAQSTAVAPQAGDHEISTRGTVAHKTGHRHHHHKHHVRHVRRPG